MQYILPFPNLDKNKANIAGGKGASLGEMTQAGIPVPGGFVVLSTTFDHFLQETDLTQEVDAILQAVDHKAIHTVESASEKIRGLIEGQIVPEDIASEIKAEFGKLDAKFVAVRSSATAEDGVDHAWAGQLDSFLNTTEENLLENVKKCWSSLFTPRAIFYRFEKELHGTQISVAVVVQKMIQSEISGIAFSVHPITEDHNQLIIEAGFGLGEAIVSGSITPDSYVVEKNPQKIIDVNVNTQTRGLFGLVNGGNEWKEISEPQASSQVLNEPQILELADLIVKIENHYGFPCDIEWAYEGGKFYIVQSRPITTLSNKAGVAQNLNSQDYVRMFAGRSLVYLFTDIFLGYYIKFGVLSIQGIDAWMCFLPKTSKEITLEEGAKLYTSKEEYDKYYQEFQKYIQFSTHYFESVLAKEKLISTEVEEFFQLASKHFSFYSKTEFFYTDKVDQEKMVISVQDFDKLKLDGRSYLNKILFEEKGFIRTLTKKIAEQFEIPESNLLNYTIKEIVELIKTGKKVTDETIKDREIFFVSQSDSFIGSSALPLVNTFFNPYREISDTIRGTVAYKGKVTGKARVLVVDFRNIESVSLAVKAMEKGEILVAETTAPEIIQACYKAAAIVTNQGGMLSHAAIISRELKIPCIVGTDKEVILNIKTGDLLEVDADNGIIKILK